MPVTKDLHSKQGDNYLHKRYFLFWLSREGNMPSSKVGDYPHVLFTISSLTTLQNQQYATSQMFLLHGPSRDPHPQNISATQYF